MAKIALDGANIVQVSIPNHIQYRKWEYQYTNPSYCNGWDSNGNCVSWAGGNAVYDWNYYYTSAQVNGKCKAATTNVLIEGKSPILQSDSVTENDTYTIPSGGSYVSGAHTNAVGSVSVGNANNVFINGKSVAINGSATKTHASTNTTISTTGVSSTVNIG